MNISLKSQAGIFNSSLQGGSRNFDVWINKCNTVIITIKVLLL